MGITAVLFLVIFFIGLFAFSPTALAGTIIGVSPNVMSLSNGLVGYWTFNNQDIRNGVILDKSGNGNNGNLMNISTSTFYVPGKIGQAGRFDGTNDVVNLGSAKLGSATNGITTSFWVYVSNSDFDETVKIILADNSGSPNMENGFFIALDDRGSGNPTNGINVAFDTQTDLIRHEFASNIISSTPTWYYIVAMYDPSVSEINVYINGNQISTTVNTSGSGNYIPDTDENLFIGAANDSSAFFKGILDDVRIYNRALSASEVKQLYMQSTGTKLQEPQTLRPNVNSLDSGLVGYWTFNNQDIRNGVILDKSGNGNHGNAINIATSTFYTQGKLGQGGKFDGGDDYVDVTYNSIFDFSSSNFTILAWVKVTKDGGEIWSSGNVFSNVEFGINQGSTGGINIGKLSLYTGNEYQSGNTNIIDNKWHHVAVTKISSSQAIFYLDGISDGTVTYTNTTWDNGTHTRKIGSRAGTSLYFANSLDDVRIYNRALSAAEVKQLYMQSAGTKLQETQTLRPNVNSLDSGLVGYWTFNNQDIRNGVILDKSGNGNNGNAMNIATSTFYTQGKMGQGAKFDGGDDRVSTSAQLPLTGAYTFSSWIKVDVISSSHILFSQDIDNTHDVGVFYSVSNNGFSYENEHNTTDSMTGWTYILDKKWHHVVLVEPYTGDVDGASLYIDGVIITSQWGGQNFSPGQSNLHLGSRIGGGLEWNGSLDDVRIYNRALSATEVRQLYNMGR